MNIYKYDTFLKVTYLDGRLMKIELTNDCDLIAFEALFHEIHYFEDQLGPGFKRIEKMTVENKIAMFVLGYKAWTKKTTGTELDYKVSKAESGMIKNFTFSLEYLRIFFTTDFWTKSKTITNYVKHYNDIQRLAAERSKDASGSAGTASTMAESLEKWF